MFCPWILEKWKGICAAISNSAWILCTVTSTLKIGRIERRFDEPRLGALKTTSTKDDATKVQHLVLADRQLKMRKIAERVDI